MPSQTMLSRLNIGASRQHLQWGRASDRSGIERPAPCDKARHDASLTSVASRVTHNCFVRRSARTSARRHCLSNCNCLSNRTRFSIRTSHPSTCHLHMPRPMQQNATNAIVPHLFYHRSLPHARGHARGPVWRPRAKELPKRGQRISPCLHQFRPLNLGTGGPATAEIRQLKGEAKS